jgi:ABC-2 type transport system ATP-binding protein
VSEIVERTARAGNKRERTPDPERLARALLELGADVSADEPGVLQVRGTTADEVGVAAGRCGVTVLELATDGGSLEDAYLELTADSVQYRGTR